MFDQFRTLHELVTAREIELGRGRIISQLDIESTPGFYPVYSSSAQGTGEFGRYGRFMFDEELITWSVDGGGRPFYRRKHKFSVTNVSGFLKILAPQKWNYRYVHAVMVLQHASTIFDYQIKAHPSVIQYLYKFPAIPLLEQSHIATVLDTVDEAIAKTEAVIAKLKQVRAGLLHDLLTRGLDENGQLRDPIAHPEQFQDSPIGRIPKGWRIAPLREVTDIASGVTLGRNLTGAGTLELPYLRVANVQDGYLDLADVKTVRIFSSELERFQLKCGDVLMNEGGDYDKLGRGTVWENQIPVCLHQNHVFRVRCRSDVLNCYFLAAVSGSETGKRYFLRSSKQSTNLASINSTQLNAFEVPVPNLAEQTAIISILAVQDDQLKVETIGLTKLRAMKSALMADLLTGRVRVPASL